MVAARFQLTTEGKQFAQVGTVRFRVAFTGISGGVTRFYGQKSCPVISVGLVDVLQTTDDWAIDNLTSMLVPANTRRGGVKKTSGLMFEDVTGTTTPGDVDVELDTIFDTVRGA